MYKKIKDLKQGDLVYEFVIHPYRGSITLELFKIERVNIHENYGIVRISNMIGSDRNIFIPINDINKTTIYTSLFVDIKEVIDLYKEKSAEIRMHIRHVFGSTNYVVKSFYMTHLKIINILRKGKKDYIDITLW